MYRTLTPTGEEIQGLPPAATGGKVVIVGRPRVGKSFLAGFIAGDREIVHTDNWIKSHSFEQVPYSITNELEVLEDWVLEGVQAVRCMSVAGLKPDMILVIECPDIYLESQHKALASMVRRSISELVEREEYRDLMYYVRRE